jgi:hypothetical protein
MACLHYRSASREEEVKCTVGNERTKEIGVLMGFKSSFVLNSVCFWLSALGPESPCYSDAGNLNQLCISNDLLSAFANQL